jgi:hypothetical protein
MDQSDKALLLQVFASVFEDFAFMFVEDEPEEEPESGGTCIQASIGFQSDAGKGFMEVIAPAEFCDELAENILGAEEEEELPADAGENALKEFLNVSCGYFLAEKFGTEAVFDLTLPETRTLPEQQCSTLFEAGGHVYFLVDESPMLARFVLEA